MTDHFLGRALGHEKRPLTTTSRSHGAMVAAITCSTRSTVVTWLRIRRRSSMVRSTSDGLSPAKISSSSSSRADRQRSGQLELACLPHGQVVGYPVGLLLKPTSSRSAIARFLARPAGWGRIQ